MQTENYLTLKYNINVLNFDLLAVSPSQLDHIRAWYFRDSWVRTRWLDENESVPGDACAVCARARIIIIIVAIVVLRTRTSSIEHCDHFQ